jgi:hypothetical protein
MSNLLDAKRIHWHDRLPEATVRGGLDEAAEKNVGGWDGYYARVAVEEGVNTVLTVDDDFERFDAFATEVILSPAEFEALDEFLRE